MGFWAATAATFGILFLIALLLGVMLLVFRTAIRISWHDDEETSED